MNKKPQLVIYKDGKVFLFDLPSFTKRKQIKIGEINYSKKTFYSVNRNRRKHVFRKDNLLALPHALIYRRSPIFYYICIPLDGKLLWTSVRALKAFGTLLDFRIKGYELQIGMKLDKFKKTKKAARTERKKLKEESKL